MPRAERSIKNIPEGKGHYVGKIHFHTGNWPFRDGFVFPVVPMQKQPDAVPRPVCFLSVLHHPSADAGRDHRGELINKSAKGCNRSLSRTASAVGEGTNPRHPLPCST